MRECKRDCLSCANSFSEPARKEGESDILHCMEQDGKVVEPDGSCDKYN